MGREEGEGFIKSQRQSLGLNTWYLSKQWDAFTKGSALISMTFETPQSQWKHSVDEAFSKPPLV